MLSIEDIRKNIYKESAKPIFFKMLYIINPDTYEGMFDITCPRFYYIGEKDDISIPVKLQEIFFFPNTKRELYRLYLDNLIKNEGENSPIKVTLEGKTFIFYVPGTYYINNGMYISKEEEQFIGVSYKKTHDKNDSNFMGMFRVHRINK